MRILVLSDSHGNTSVLKRIISFHSDIKNIFFLGDNIRDIEYIEHLFRDRNFYSVSGNCDIASMTPSANIEIIEGVKIFYTHGHKFGVKYSTEMLLEETAKRNCSLALYGHTHCKNIYYSDGVYAVNPGSVSCSRSGKNSYAIVDITNKGICPVIMEI